MREIPKELVLVGLGQRHQEGVNCVHIASAKRRPREVDTIDTFLMALSEPHEYQLLGNLSHIQRVEEILRRSSGNGSRPQLRQRFPAHLE
jgi:hypothetical protein